MSVFKPKSKEEADYIAQTNWINKIKSNIIHRDDFWKKSQFSDNSINIIDYFAREVKGISELYPYKKFEFVLDGRYLDMRKITIVEYLCEILKTDAFETKEYPFSGVSDNISILLFHEPGKFCHICRKTMHTFQNNFEHKKITSKFWLF